MLDATAARVVAGVLFALAFTGLMVLGRSLLVPHGKVVASRAPVRGSEALWLGATMVAHAWPLGVLVFPAWFYAWPGIGDFPEATAVQVLGVVLWVLGMGTAGWAWRSLGRSLVVEIQVTEGQRLVEDGPYAWVRHPFYTSNATAAFGLALVFLSPLLLGVAFMIAAIAMYRGRLEDEFLRTPQAFGERYAAYSSRTGRFLPRLRRSGP